MLPPGSFALALAKTASILCMRFEENASLTCGRARAFGDNRRCRHCHEACLIHVGQSVVSMHHSDRHSTGRVVNIYRRAVTHLLTVGRRRRHHRHRMRITNLVR